MPSEIVQRVAAQLGGRAPEIVPPMGKAIAVDRPTLYEELVHGDYHEELGCRNLR
jgi:hypothetical protein